MLGFLQCVYRAVVFGFRTTIDDHDKYDGKNVLDLVLLDGPGLVFFTTYTLLLLFWAEIYHQVRASDISLSLSLSLSLSYSSDSSNAATSGRMPGKSEHICTSIFTVFYYCSMQARSLPFASLRPLYAGVNCLCYVVQGAIWILLKRENRGTMIWADKCFSATLCLFAVLVGLVFTCIRSKGPIENRIPGSKAFYFRSCNPPLAGVFYLWWAPVPHVETISNRVCRPKKETLGSRFSDVDMYLLLYAAWCGSNILLV